MIPVQTIIQRINSALDAEGFERYTFEEDFKPAINYAKDWTIAVFNKLYASNKLSEEHLREITKAYVYTTSRHSRVSIDENIWSILAVYPEITYNGTLQPVLNPEVSVYHPNAKYINSIYSATRTTAEKINQNKRNPFAPGSEKVDCPESKTYAYVGFLSDGPTREVIISPTLIQKLVAVIGVIYPPDIIIPGNTLPFPLTLTNIIVSKSLEWISWKQGDQTNLHGVTEQELRELIQILG